MKEQLELFPETETIVSEDTIGVVEKRIEDVEWCFQFFNNEPIVFAYANEGEKSVPLTLTVEPTEGQGLTFQQNGMQFTIFPRPISEETKLDREKSKENDVR